MKKNRKLKIALTVIFLGLVGAILAWVTVVNRAVTNSDKLSVSASYYPLYEFTQKIGGDKVSVTSMTPQGADSHDYEPSARDIANAQKANVFVYNGAGYESWAEDFLESYKGVAVKASKGIDILDADHDHHDEEEHNDDQYSHEERLGDPHFWLDPVAAQQIVNNIRDGLSFADPENADYYAKNAANYNQQLSDLDQEFAASLQGCTQDTIVTSHNAFSYVAKRYGFEIKSISGQSHDEEPSVAELAEIVDLVRQQNIKFIFNEQLAASNLTDTIAQETGAQTLLLDPIEGLADESQNYVEIQKQNIQNLRRGLACN